MIGEILTSQFAKNRPIIYFHQKLFPSLIYKPALQKAVIQVAGGSAW
jgi:hypothetical protein